MTIYSKIRLLSKANGLFKANAIIVKTDDAFFLVCKNGDLPLDGEQASVPGATFEASSGVAIRRIDAGEAMDSIETLIILSRVNTVGILSSYRVVLDGGITSVNGVFSVNLDDVFTVESQQASLISGVAVKAAYTRNETYTGFSGYHHNQRVHRFNTPVATDKPWRIGVELECYARNQAAYNSITGARSNWFQCESDSSLTERSYPIELKTIPLRACDAKSVDFWNEPMARLAQLAVSRGCSTTGLHVHISKEILGSTETERQMNLSKLCVFYSYYVEDDPEAHARNVVICGREEGYHAGNIKTGLGDFAKKVGINKVGESSEAFTEMSDELKGAYRNTRKDINIGNWNSYGTIEFRKGDGRISKTRLAAICTWWEQMCLYCVNTHPKDMSFRDFFDKVCREYPAVAYFFQQDEEA